MEQHILSTQGMQKLGEIYNENFFWFCKAIIDPKFFDDNLHKKVCDFLQYGGNCKALVLPRSFLKTSITDIYLLWRACKDPNIRTLKVSNSADNAAKSIEWIRRKVETESIITSFYSHIRPIYGKVRWSNSCAELARTESYPEGTFESAGVGTNIIRRHYNIIDMDDTIAPRKDAMGRGEIMPTRDDIEKAVGFHKLTIPLLVNPDDERLVVCTRWAQYDVIDYIKKNEPHFNILDLKATHNGKIDGKPLYRRYMKEELKRIRATLGSYLFSSLYMNTPLSADQMVFHPDWTQYYTPDELPKGGVVVMTIDPADPPTGKADQCYSAIIVAKHFKSKMYVMRAYHNRITDSTLIEKALDYAAECDATKIRIETDKYKHLVYAFKDAIAKRPGVHIIVEDVKSGGRQKEERIMHSLQAFAENGGLYLLKTMPALEDEMQQFPNGKFVDMLDALAWQMPSHKPMWAENVKEEVKLKRNEMSADGILEGLEKRRTKTRYPFDVQLAPENLALVGLPPQGNA